MRENKSKDRLGLRFHQSFIPERRYLSALLQFAAKDGMGADETKTWNEAVSDKTGIPTGKSSGKVPAMIQYATGMGLIHAEGKGKERRIRPTAFGETVLANDPQLAEALTQWLIHLNLCRRIGGAEIWHHAFGPAGDLLGHRFGRESLDRYLERLFGKTNRSWIGPMQQTYEEAAALKKTRALMSQEGELRRGPAPVSPESVPGYGWFLLTLWDQHFPQDRQVTFKDFEAETYWARLHGWNDLQTEEILELLRENEVLTIDKQMRPWILARRMENQSLLTRIYQ